MNEGPTGGRSEVARLKQLFSDSGSVERYLGAFLSIARVKAFPIPDDPLSIDRSGWDVPLELAIGLGARIGRGEPLAANWLLAWFLAHPEKNLRTPARRCPEEFETTFRALFDDRFPDGLKVSKPRKTLSTTYEAASGEFSAAIEPKLEDGGRVLDVSGLRKPIEIAQEIADEAMDALDGYSRLLGKDPEAGTTLRGHLMLPPMVREAADCPARDDLLHWVGPIVGGNGLAPVLDVVETVTGNRPEKPTKKDLTDTADMLARLGIGMAPDPRFALRRPKPDEPVVLFDLGKPVEEAMDVSDVYQEAALRIALGVFVAQADGTISAPERDSLSDQVRTLPGLSDAERRRLQANLVWFMAVPPDMTLLRKRLKDAGDEETAVLRDVLVSAAHADGEVSPEEVSSLERAYKALGLDPDLVYTDLHSGPSDAPVSVRPATPAGAGEAIPDEQTPPTDSGLDLDRVAAIRADTSRVSSVLGEIFSGEDDTNGDVASEESNTPAIDAQGEDDPLPGLDPAHARLVTALVAQEHWDDAALEALARTEGLLPAGALETINEWAFERYDEALLDAYDGYDVEHEVAAAIRAALNPQDEMETA